MELPEDEKKSKKRKLGDEDGAGTASNATQAHTNTADLPPTQSTDAPRKRRRRVDYAPSEQEQTRFAHWNTLLQSVRAAQEPGLELPIEVEVFPSGIFVEMETPESPVAADVLVQQSQPALDAPPVEQFEFYDEKASGEVIASIEDIVFEQEHEAVFYPVDEDYKGLAIELTDEEIASANSGQGKGPWLFTPVISASLKEQQHNDTLNVPRSLTFHFLDVGQGSGTLVVCPYGETFLIDLGTSKAKASEETLEKGDAGEVETKLLEYIQKFKKIDYLIVSHSDQDHISFIPKLKKTVEVGQVLLGGRAGDYKSTIFQKNLTAWMVGAAKRKQAEEEEDESEDSSDEDESEDSGEGKSKKESITAASVVVKALINDGRYYSEAPSMARGDRMLQARDVDIWILSANAPRQEKNTLVEALDVSATDAVPGTAENTSSIVVCFEYKGKRVIISADATFSTDYKMLADDNPWSGNLKCYALSGGHHGSRQSFSPKLLQALDPEWIHFSADMKDTFMHPEWSLVQRIASNCPKIFGEPVWGPHGVVVGDKQAFTPNLRKSFQFEELREQKEFWANAFGAHNVGYLHTLVIVALKFLKARDQEMRRMAAAEEEEEALAAAKASAAQSDSAEIVTPEAEAEGGMEIDQPSEAKPEEEANDPARWWIQILNEVDLWRTTVSDHGDAKVLLEAMVEDSLPATAYWAARFADMEKEEQRVDALEDRQFKRGKYWHWFITEANLFTTLEGANQGVYWQLDIDSNGQALTQRT